MARLSEQQTEQLRKERTEQILQAALKVFSENGIEGTKMGMIAKAAGVSHGLLYHYFQSKEEVLHNSLQWAVVGSSELIQTILATDVSPARKIEHFLQLALSLTNQDVFRIIQRFAQHPDLDEPTRQLIEQTGERYIQLIYPIIIEGQEAGQFIQEDPVKLTALLLTTISGLIADDLEWLQQDLDWNISILMRMIRV